MNENSSTIVRAMSVLRGVAEASGSVGVKDIADRLGLPMSTTHRLLDLLVEAGYVDRDKKRRRYLLGLEFFRLAALVAHKTTMASIVQPGLDQLAAESGETAIFAAYLPAERVMTYAAKSDSRHVLRFRVHLNIHMPLEWGASGLAILAYLPADTQARILSEAKPSPVSQRILTPEVFRDRIARVRRDGFAVTESEKLPDSIGIAGPIHGGFDTVTGSITLTIPKVRFNTGDIASYARLVKATAERFSVVRGESAT